MATKVRRRRRRSGTGVRRVRRRKASTGVRRRRRASGIKRRKAASGVRRRRRRTGGRRGRVGSNGQTVTLNNALGFGLGALCPLGVLGFAGQGSFAQSMGWGGLVGIGLWALGGLAILNMGK